MESVKLEIERKHQLKPKPAKQKIFYAGKYLNQPDQTLGEVLQGVSLL
jgi:hypothetical protein